MLAHMLLLKQLRRRRTTRQRHLTWCGARELRLVPASERSKLFSFVSSHQSLKTILENQSRTRNQVLNLILKIYRDIGKRDTRHFLA